MISIKDISFGFPQNITVSNTIEALDTIKKQDYSNKNVHLKLTIDKLMKKNFNTEQLSKEIMESTGAARVKIDFIYDTNSSLRAKEISEQTNPIEKFKSYAELHSIKYNDSLLNKIQKIQDDMLLESFTPHDTFTLEYMSLRGAIGIMDGQHKEEVSYNFKDDFNNGVIGICGSSGSGKCITGDSIILTDNGFTKIGKFALPKVDGFKPFKKVLYTQKNDKAESSHFYSENVNKTIKIKNSLGMSLEGTPDHPILIFNSNCEYQFKKLKDIKPGDYVCVPRGMSVFPEENKPFYRYINPKSRNAIKRTLPTIMTKELARFLGYYVANGTIDRNCIAFCSQNKKIVEDYSYCVKKVFNMDIRTSDNRNYCFTSNQIKNYLSSLFAYPMKTAHHKTIPATVLESTKECQRAFLRAYFDCDSSIYKSVFELCTASKNCADIVQNMLLNFGIISVHRTKRVKKYNWNYHILSVSSSELDKLVNIILHDSIKYNYSYDKIRNTNIDIIPYVKEYSYQYFNAGKNGWVKEGDLLYCSPCRKTSSKCVSYSFFQRYIDNAKKINSPKCKSYVDKMSDIVENNYFYSPIISVEEKNIPTTVYDFTIPTTHKFYSNGFISHNTTILENMHPYPCMLSRIGTLKEHFCLKDSHRILIYRSSSGKKYRISMYIDGCAKNVMTRYFVETKEGDNNWEPIKSIDGSSDVYNEWVEATFGPKELFLRTSFYTNAAIKNMPDLAQATKGEKMALFSTLAGTDYLSTFSEQAKLAISQKEKDIKELKDQLSGFDELEQRQSENESIIENNTVLIKEYKDYIENDTKELAEYEIKQQDFIKASASYDIYRTQLNEKNVELRDVEGKISICSNNIEAYEQQLSETDLYKEQLKWYDENMAKRKSLISEEQKVRDEFNNLQASMEKKQSEYNKNQMKLVSTKGTINTLEREIKHLNSSIPELDDNCPVCGAPLQQHKKEQLEKEIKDIKEQIEIAETQLTENNNLKEDLEKWLKEHSLESFKSELTTINNKLVSISNDITDIDTYAESLDIDGIKDILNNTGNHLEAERNNLETLLSKKVDIENKRTELQSIMDNIPEDFSDKITILKRGIEDTKQSIATLTAENTMAQKELDRIKSLSEQIKSIKKEVDAANVDIKEYTIIQQAFSNNGIQAIELDSAAPEISNIANNILEECYGPRFTVSFDTQRDTKDGRRIDDFIINVFDSDNARLKRLDLISSGEGTLIKQTLYYAFSVIRARRTGFCFKTRFLDESDSALDSELRIKYLKMIESAHKQCGAHQTILITHSSELKEIIEQKIEL